MHYLALCCIVKDEDPFIGEWLTYHSLLGVEHFYLYDNESAKPLLRHPVVARYQKADRLTMIRVAGKAAQCPAYRHCLETFGHENHWIGFLDMDEFVCFPGNKRSEDFAWLDIRPLLSEFEDYAALALNWRYFTSSGHIRRPEGLVIENYTQAWPKPATGEFHVKSFVRPLLVEKINNPHLFLFRQGYFAVTEDHRPMPPDWPWSPVSHKRAWINHYYYKSREDFEYKLKRGRADILEERAEKDKKAYEAQAEAQAGMRGKVELWATKYAPLVKKYERTLAPEMPQPETENGIDGYLRLCQEALTYRPDGPWAAFYADHTPSRPERYNRAEALLCKALEAHANEEQFWVMRAYLARLQGKFRQAEKFLNKALMLKQAPAIYEEMFHLALAEGRMDDAKILLFYLKNFPRMASMEENFAIKLDLFAKLLKQKAS